VPRLHTAFRPGTDRRAVDEPVRRLHDLQNRVAHHEALLRNDLDARQHDLVTVAGLLSEPLRNYLLMNSKAAALIPYVRADDSDVGSPRTHFVYASGSRSTQGGPPSAGPPRSSSE